ncbi:MAG TPA: iron ABC transporter substrate-binding protein, partial [Marinobacter hydrocarbonoclasticus]|nr:iron ABC transporter substrate-binding protein [Marinobacter nauticus]
TDLAGRTVEVPESVERVILGESRYIPALAILEGEQLPDRLAGLLPDFEMTDP